MRIKHIAGTPGEQLWGMQACYLPIGFQCEQSESHIFKTSNVCCWHKVPIWLKYHKQSFSVCGIYLVSVCFSLEPDRHFFGRSYRLRTGSAGTLFIANQSLASHEIQNIRCTWSEGLDLIQCGNRELKPSAA